MSRPTTVLLVDDQRLFLGALRHLLEVRGFQIVGTAQDGLEALVKARALRPDLILMDVQMPGCDGLDATRRIKAELPEAKIVMLTVSGDDEILFEAIAAGASGFLLKNLEDESFCQLLSRLADGEPPFAPGLAARILADYARCREGLRRDRPARDSDEVELSPRQKEILALVARGLTYKEIGSRLYLSQSTVKYHMVEILDRLKLTHRSEAIAYAQRHGLLAERGDTSGPYGCASPETRQIA